MVVPVMKDASSEARNRNALATSLGVPSRPRGIASSIDLIKVGDRCIFIPSVKILPGSTPLTVIP